MCEEEKVSELNRMRQTDGGKDMAENPAAARPEEFKISFRRVQSTWGFKVINLMNIPVTQYSILRCQKKRCGSVIL